MSAFLIYAQHLAERFSRNALIWAGAFALYAAILLSVYPSFAESMTQDFTEMYPQAMIEAFNITALDIPTGFLAAEVYSYAPLVLAFFPIMALAGSIAGEEERGALDMTLTNPISRRDIVLSNWVTIAGWMFVILLATGLATWIAALAMDIDLTARESFRAPLNIFPIAMLFGSLALLLSTRMRSKGAVVGATFGLMFMTYLLDIAGKLASDFSWLSKLSPFHYHGSAITDGVNFTNSLGMTALAVVLMLLAIPSFQRRDIYT